MNELVELAGARLQRLDGPHAELFAVTLHRRELHGVLVMALDRGRAEWGWEAKRPRGLPASGFVRQLRKHLENARVIAAQLHAGGATLALGRGEGRPRLHLAMSPANLVIEVDGRVVGAAKPGALREAGAAVGAPWPELAPGESGLADTFAGLAAAGPRLVDRVLAAAPEARKKIFERALRRRVKKLERRIAAIDGDIARVDGVAALRLDADLLLAHLHTIPAEASEAVVQDWITGASRTIALGAGRSAREEADALYRRAGKLERGARVATQRRESTEAEVATLVGLLEAAASDAESLEQLERDAQRAGVSLRSQASSSRGAERERRPHRTFFGTGDRPIHVGRSAKDNDRVTQGARAWDHWLHARGVRGSHVVIPLGKREACPPELLLDAAHLAAHYSASKGEPLVDVQHCQRRYVRKPKGMAVGAVLVERERVLALRVEPGRLAKLLATEDR